jgi:hypothetical protein
MTLVGVKFRLQVFDANFVKNMQVDLVSRPRLETVLKFNTKFV